MTSSLLQAPLPVEIGSYTALLHIHKDERGVAWIDDSNVKVVEVILDHVQGNSPEQIHEEYPHLSLAQVYTSLAYYYDHRQEIDALMQQWQERYEAEYAKPENQALRREIRARAAVRSASKEEVVA